LGIPGRRTKGRAGAGRVGLKRRVDRWPLIPERRMRGDLPESERDEKEMEIGSVRYARYGGAKKKRRKVEEYFVLNVRWGEGGGRIPKKGERRRLRRQGILGWKKKKKDSA